MFKHVVVQPKVTIDDFEDYGEMVEVANKAFYFVTGTPDPDEVDPEEDNDDK